MHVDSDRLRLSPSDLSSFLGCRHRTGLDLAVVAGALEKPAQDDVRVQALRDRGAAHERAYVDSLRARGIDLVVIDHEQPLSGRLTATLGAMRAGAEAIVQAALQYDDWMGYADILHRVETPSALGAWSYEPYDTKLSRETSGGTILQLATYVELLEHLQGVRPERFHVVAPAASVANRADVAESPAGFAITSYRWADFAAYVRLVRQQLAETLGLAQDVIVDTYYPEPVEQCEVCRWWLRCNARRRQDDHPGFIAGASRLHRQELTRQGIATLAAAAAMPLPIPFKPARGSGDTSSGSASRRVCSMRNEHAAGQFTSSCRLSTGKGWPVCRSRRPVICFWISRPRASRAKAAGSICSGSEARRVRPHNRMTNRARSGRRRTTKNGRRSKPPSTPSCRPGPPIPACTSTTSATTNPPRSRS
jgi:hypothetical protein